jgi:hypothetical protein
LPKKGHPTRMPFFTQNEIKPLLFDDFALQHTIFCANAVEIDAWLPCAAVPCKRGTCPIL